MAFSLYDCVYEYMYYITIRSYTLEGKYPIAMRSKHISRIVKKNHVI